MRHISYSCRTFPPFLTLVRAVKFIRSYQLKVASMLCSTPFKCFLRGPTPLWGGGKGNGRRKRNPHSLAFVITKTSGNFHVAFYKRPGKFSRPLKGAQMGLRCRLRHALKPTQSFMFPLKTTARKRNSGHPTTKQAEMHTVM